MSVDREYKIKVITTTEGDTGAAVQGLQATGKAAEQAGEKLDKTRQSVEEMTTHLPEGAESFQKYKGVLGETSHESDKLEASHRALHLALEKLGLPARELGEILHGGLTKATAALVGFTSAWEIWQSRVESGIQVLSGFELPDLSKSTNQLSENAQALQDYAEALDSVLEKYNSFDAASDRAIAKLKQEYELRKKLAEAEGKPTAALDAEERQKELDEKENKMHELNMSADIKRRQAADIHVGTKEEDTRNLQDASAQADAARKGREESNQRLELIERLQGGSMAPKDIADYIKFYGTNTKGSEATAIEQRNIQQANEVISRFDALTKAQPQRETERTRKEKLMKEAGEEQGEADVIKQELPSERAAAQQTATVNHYTEEIRRGKELQRQFVDKGPGMDINDIRELVSIIRDMGDKFRTQIAGNVTKQEMQQELNGLRRLMESKGK